MKKLSQEYSCNRVFIDQKKTYSLIKKARFTCKAKFLTSHTKHWIGTRLEFEGTQAAIFYDSLKNKALGWDHMDLENTNLGRIDLCYTRSLKETDKCEDYENFLKITKERIRLKNASLKVELKPQVNPKTLEMGHRKTSGNFFRVYKRPNGKSIRFELEIKLNIAKNFQFYLFTSQFEKLETQLTQHYYSYINTQFEIQCSCYTDWVVQNFRSIRFLQIPKNSLVTTYLTNRLINTLADQVFLYKLFQLLSYIRQLEYSSNFLVDQEYRIISFKLTDFLEFLGTNKNHYQLQKLVKFLIFLQTLPPILNSISNTCFRSINIFPYVKVFKKKSWYVKLAIAEELYFYKYPFYFPEAFLNYQNKYQFQAQINFFIAFSVVKIEKVFEVEEFLEQFELSNSNLRKVRDSLIQTFVLAKDLNLIEGEFGLVLKTNKLIKVTELTTNLISRTKLLYFKEVTY